MGQLAAVPFDRSLKSGLEVCRGAETELAFGAIHVKASPWLPIGLARVPRYFALESGQLRDQYDQFTNRDFSSRTKIHRIGLVVIIGREDPSRPARAICN